MKVFKLLYEYITLEVIEMLKEKVTFLGGDTFGDSFSMNAGEFHW